MAKAGRRNGGLFGGQFRARISQEIEEARRGLAPVGDFMLRHVAPAVLPGGGAISMVVDQAARRAPRSPADPIKPQPKSPPKGARGGTSASPARAASEILQAGAPLLERLNPLSTAVMPLARAADYALAPEPQRGPPRSRAQRFLEGLVLEAADGVGEAAGLARGAWHTVEGLGETAKFVNRLQTPMLDLMTGRETATEQLLRVGRDGIAGAVSYGARVAQDPNKLLADIGAQAHRQAVRLNPAAAPQAATFGGELARRFDVGMNQGELLWDVGTLAAGGAAVKGASKFGTPIKALTKADYEAMQYPPRVAALFARPATGRGHHFVPRRVTKTLPWLAKLTDGPPFILKELGATVGQERFRHYSVDPFYHGGTLQRKGGLVTWSGKNLGWKKHGLAGRIWHGSPRPLKVIVGGVLGTGTAAEEIADD